MSLDEMFDDSEPAPEPETAEETPAEPEQKGESEETETGTEEAAIDASDVETVEETKPAEPPSAEHKGQLAALIAERDKRQRAEARVKELEGELGEESETDPITDIKDQALKDKIELSRDIMIELDGDYEAKYEPYFMRMVVDDKGNVKDEDLLQKFRTATNPAKFARDTAKKEMDYDRFSSADYEAELRNKIRQELLAEMKQDGITAADVPDLTTSADAGSNSLPLVANDETLDDMEFGIDQ